MFCVTLSNPELRTKTSSPAKVEFDSGSKSVANAFFLSQGVKVKGQSSAQDSFSQTIGVVGHLVKLKGNALALEHTSESQHSSDRDEQQRRQEQVQRARRKDRRGAQHACSTAQALKSRRQATASYLWTMCQAAALKLSSSSCGEQAVVVVAVVRTAKLRGPRNQAADSGHRTVCDTTMQRQETAHPE